MALPKETQERIKADAEAYANDKYGEYASNCNDLEYYKWKECVDVYIAGATAEATKAFEMYKMLVLLSQYHYQAKEGRELNHDAIIGKIEEHLQQWNAGKVVEKEKEPLIPIAVYKQQGCNVSNSRPCPHCGKELNRDRNLCCRECGEEVENDSK